MLHYFILLAYILVICIIPIKSSKVKLLLCFIPFFLFFASRVDWTPDYYNYEELFYQIHDNKQYSIDSNISEYGFKFLCIILPSYRSLIWVITLLYTSSLYLLFYKFIIRKYWLVAFIILFVNHQFLLGTISAMRSCVVASLFIFALHAKLNRLKIIPFLLLIVAFFFHRSAIVLIFFLAFERFKHSRTVLYWIVVLIFILITISFLNPSFFSSKLLGILESSNTFESYSQYISISKLSVFFYINILINVFIIITNIYLLVKSKNYSFWLLLSIFYYTILSIPNIGMISRFTSYLGPAILVGLSSWDEMGVKYKLLKYSYIGIIIASCLYFFIFSFTKYSGFHLYINYHSTLFK